MDSQQSDLGRPLGAHDDKLWVVAPGLEFVHPRSASLNDFELLEVFVPVAIGSTYDVLGLLVRGFNVPQGNFPVTVGQDPVKVLFHHEGKLPKRRQTAPF